MVAPVPIDSSSGCAWTKRMLRALTRATLRRTPDTSSNRHEVRGGACTASDVPPQSHDNPAGRSQHSGVDYPELAARTRRFSYGAPRALAVSPDGARVIFLRSSGPEDPSDALWVYDVAAR